MFRDRPLTGLFLAATITVDLVVMLVGYDPHNPSEIVVGLITGQVAALALWVVRGMMHRLARIGWVVCAVGLLAYLLKIDAGPQSTWLAFYLIYATAIIMSALAGNLLRHALRDRSQDTAPAARWQVPLIEFFGWTIVVAVLSFGAQHMDFNFLTDGAVDIVLLLLAVPVTVALFVPSDIRRLKLASLIPVAIAMLATMACWPGTEASGPLLTLVQTGYLAAWLFVLALDDHHGEKPIGEESLPAKSV